MEKTKRTGNLCQCQMKIIKFLDMFLVVSLLASGRWSLLFCFASFTRMPRSTKRFFFVLFFCGWTETPRTPPRHAQNNNNIVGERKREIYDRRKRDNRPRQKDFWTFEKKRNKCKCFSKPLVCVCVCALEFFWWLLQSSAFPAYPSS